MSLSCQPLSTASICLLDHDETCLGCSCRLPAALTQEGQKCKSLCVQSFQISLFHTCSADNCGGGLPITTIGCHSFCVAQGSSGRFLETPPNSQISKGKSNKLAVWPKSPWAQTSAARTLPNSVHSHHRAEWRLCKVLQNRKPCVFRHSSCSSTSGLRLLLMLKRMTTPSPGATSLFRLLDSARRSAQLRRHMLHFPLVCCTRCCALHLTLHKVGKGTLVRDCVPP